MPAIAVVVPSYNHAAFVGEAVRSALAQTLDDLEVIVVDDGSTDASRSVLAALRDPRLTIVEQPNRGAHAALNAGIARASAPLIAPLNSDDAFHPERLARAVARLTAEPDVGLLGSWIEIVDAGGAPLGVKHAWRDCEPWPLVAPARSLRAGTDARAVLCTENWLATTSNFVFRRADWQRLGGFRPLRYTHDWDFALRLARDARLAVLENPLLRYRIHGANTIREDRVAMAFEILWCLAVHLPRQTHGGALDGLDAARMEQVSHSLYTFGCDRELIMLLTLDLARDDGLALALLDPADARRGRLLDAIRARLAQQPAAEPVARPAGGRRRWLRGGW